MVERLRVVLEFKKDDMRELELYAKLLEFSNPPSIVKDILKGNLPLSVIREDERN